MIDEYVNKGWVTANVVWSVVVGLLAIGWGVILLVPQYWAIGGMFAATACATSALAAVLHMRCYMVRLAALVRGGQPSFDDERPRPIRRI